MNNQPGSDKIVFLTNVRLSFPHLVAPYALEGQGEPKYSADFILQATHPGWTQFHQLVQKLALEKWKDHASAVIQMVNRDSKNRCYGDGSEKVNKQTFQPYDGYQGMVFVSANRKKDQPPQVIQADGNAVDPMNTMAYSTITREMYGGCRVNAAIKPWMQDNQYGRGIRCELLAVQKAGDDTPFGEGVADASGFFGQVVPSGDSAVLPWQAAPTMPAPPFGGAPVPPFLM